MQLAAMQCSKWHAWLRKGPSYWNRQSFRYLLQYAAFFAEMKARRARRAKAADMKSGSVVSIALSKPVNTLDRILLLVQSMQCL